MIRLLTPLGMRYDDSYEKAYPFDGLVEDTRQPGMILDMVEIMKTAMERGIVINVIINNRAGGNAPSIAELIAKKFMGKSRPASKGQMDLW